MAGTLVIALSVLVGGAVLIYFAISRNIGTNHEVPEPPVVAPTIPYVGHVIGMLRSKFNYYVQLSQSSSLPIFTMHMPGMKMYIVTTPHLVQAVQKQPKVLAFPPIEAKFSRQICGVSDEAHAILMKNVNGDDGDWGLSMDSYATMKSALAPGAGLDNMNRVMFKDVATLCGKLKASVNSTPRLRLDLYDWLRDIVTTATTNAVYGPQNPYKDPTIRNAFWDFESDLVTILSGILVSFSARKGLAGRAKVVNAFEKFFMANGQAEASLLLQNRFDTSKRHGLSLQDIARYEVGGSVAILVNTAPAVFWVLLYLYSSPSLLEEVRSEIRALASKVESESKSYSYTLDITAVKTGCLLLASVLQEVLRLRTMGTSVREVMKDTVLDGQWLLKKGAMIQMPSRVIHSDETVWGTDVNSFNPRRFMREKTRTAESHKRVNAAAFRGFRGGSTLCPGRHFATNEILAVVVMVVMQFDLHPVGTDWQMPTCYKTNVASVVMEPDSDVKVDVSSCSDTHSWNFVLEDSDEIFSLAVEDRNEAPDQ